MSGESMPMPAPGDVVASEQVRLRLPDLVRYAGASGDFNPIHWNHRVATEVGLPDVIAHGMLTMASAARVLDGWLGDPGRVESFAVRFTAPVVVPDDGEGAELTITVTAAEVLDDGRLRVDVTTSVAGVPVLGQASAVVRVG